MEVQSELLTVRPMIDCWTCYGVPLGDVESNSLCVKLVALRWDERSKAIQVESRWETPKENAVGVCLRWRS